MRTLRFPIVTSVVLLVSGLAACGLDAGGKLAGDGGRVDVMSSGGQDAALGDDDATAPPTSGDDGGNSADDATDEASIPRRDASTTSHPDSGRPTDAAVDAPPLTCSQCVRQMCPTQVAACQQGSDCLAYRDCSEGCSGTSSSTCSSACESKHGAGEAAFGALTICGLGCGAGCVAALTFGTP